MTHLHIKAIAKTTTPTNTPTINMYVGKTTFLKTVAVDSIAVSFSPGEKEHILIKTIKKKGWYLYHIAINSIVMNSDLICF